MSTPRDEDDKNNNLNAGRSRSSERKIVEKHPEFKRANMSFEPKLTPFLKETGSPKPNHEGVSTTRWNVESGNKIPSYPLERTVKVDATTKVVASRVDANIKKRSVQAEFDSDKARAICVTEGFLKYHVTLFDAGNNQTLVEVQRRKGCSMEFRRERLAIINAAKGSFTQTQSMPRLTIPPDLVSESKYAPPSYEDITAMLENIVLSLHAKHRDSKLLALRHVAGMTDIETANVHTSFNAAKIILDSEIGVREIITDYLVSGPQDETGIMMRHSGLTILTNCLTLLEKGDKIEELSKKENIWFTESLFPSLVEDIKRCKSYHNAFLSSKCLCMLLKKSSIVRATAREDDDLRDILEKAASIGQKNHNKLHDEAESTIRALECI